MSNYPASLDDNTTLPNPTAASYQDTLSHAAQHANANTSIKSLEAKLGIGATVPSSTGLFLIPTGPGTTAWSQLTSSQLAATLTDETGSGSAVFANTPTLITPKVDTITENTTGNGVTVAGANFKSGVLTTANSIPAAAVQADAIAALNMQYGMVRARQGGTSGDAGWYSGGTANTDTSAKPVFIQLGTIVVSGNPTVVTFPVTFSQSPHVQLTSASAIASNAWPIITNVTATTVSIRMVNDAGGIVTTEAVNWYAVGQ